MHCSKYRRKMLCYIIIPPEPAKKNVLCNTAKYEGISIKELNRFLQTEFPLTGIPVVFCHTTYMDILTFREV